MIIKRDSQTGFEPEALELLKHSIDVPIYNIDHGKRPPAGIYAISLSDVWTSLKAVLDELDTVQIGTNYRNSSAKELIFDDRLMQSQQELLSAINRHFDDCNSILRCFYPPSIDENALRKKDPVRYFNSNISWYRKDLIAPLYNYYKHHQGRFRSIFIFTQDYGIPGYFAESVDSNGAIGPNLKIHKPFKGSPTAFSFFRDLRLHVYGIYAVSHFLAGGVSQIANIPMPTSALGACGQGPLPILERIASLPFRFFSDELHKAVPSIKIADLTSESKELTLSFPDKNSFPLSLPNVFQVSVRYKGDGVSRSFKAPYLP